MARVRFINNDWNCVTVEIRRGNKQAAQDNPVLDVTSLRKGDHQDYANTGEDYHYRREADPQCARDPVWANRFDTKAIFDEDDDVDIEID